MNWMNIKYECPRCGLLHVKLRNEVLRLEKQVSTEVSKRRAAEDDRIMFAESLDEFLVRFNKKSRELRETQEKLNSLMMTDAEKV